MNQNTRTRVSIVLLAIGIYRQHRKLILNIFTAAYTHLIFLFEESNIISRIWCPLDVSISFNELQCHYRFLYVLTAILDSNQCGRFCGPTPKPLGQWQLYIHFSGSCRIRTCGTFYSSSVFKTDVLNQLYQTSNSYFLRKQKDSNLRNLSVRHVSSVLVSTTHPYFHTRDLLFQLLFPSQFN